MLQKQERKEHMHWQSTKGKKGEDKNMKAYTRAADVSAYNGLYPHTHRAEHVSTIIGLYQGVEHEFAFLALIKSWKFYLHLLVCMESWACVCMCLHMSRAGRVSSYVGRYQEHSMFQDVCLHVWRAWHVSACVCTYQELSEYPLCLELSVSAASVCA